MTPRRVWAGGVVLTAAVVGGCCRCGCCGYSCCWLQCGAGAVAELVCEPQAALWQAAGALCFSSWIPMYASAFSPRSAARHADVTIPAVLLLPRTTTTCRTRPHTPRSNRTCSTARASCRWQTPGETFHRWSSRALRCAMPDWPPLLACLGTAPPAWISLLPLSSIMPACFLCLCRVAEAQKGLDQHLEQQQTLQQQLESETALRVQQASTAARVCGGLRDHWFIGAPVAGAIMAVCRVLQVL